jgi:hypothetical protein
MKQITLTDANFKILNMCVQFCIEDVQETGGYLEASRPELTTRTREADLLGLESAIELCTVDTNEGLLPVKKAET